MAVPTLKVAASEADVSNELCELIISSANDAIKERGVFTLGVSGCTFSS